MTAYWVSQYREITDEDKMSAYSKLGRPALEAAGGRFLARGLPEQLYEAGQSMLTVVIEFESVELDQLGDLPENDARDAPGIGREEFPLPPREIPAERVDEDVGVKVQHPSAVRCRGCPP